MLQVCGASCVVRLSSKFAALVYILRLVSLFRKHKTKKHRDNGKYSPREYSPRAGRYSRHSDDGDASFSFACTEHVVFVAARNECWLPDRFFATRSEKLNAMRRDYELEHRPLEPKTQRG